jgi:hypothetical protein
MSRTVLVTRGSQSRRGEENHRHKWLHYRTLKAAAGVGSTELSPKTSWRKQGGARAGGDCTVLRVRRKQACGWEGRFPSRGNHVSLSWGKRRALS